MKIGITGGSGFIGRYIHEKLIQSENQYSIKNIDIAKPEFDVKSEFIHGDIRDQDSINKFCDQVDCVIHLAAAHHDFGIDESEYFDVNVNGTKKLLNAMENNDVHKIIFYSSVAVYGLNELPADESTQTKPENPYGNSKLEAEKEILAWCDKDSKNRAFIIRPAVVIGPRNVANMFFLIDQIYKNKYLFNFGSGANIKSMAYVKNLVDFTSFLIEHRYNDLNSFEIYNAVDYPQLQIKDTIRIIHEELNKKLPKINLPLSLVVGIGKLFDLMIKITGKNLPISTARIRKITATTHFEATKIQQLDYKPSQNLEVGLREMVQWYLQECITL